MNTELGNLGEISRSRVQEFYWGEEVRENLSSLRFQKKKKKKKSPNYCANLTMKALETE